ncbi:MAG: DUF4293 domain-containing protein [Flavobacteriales bacterium]|nr:DUF4293 domain-containing protein [Flavobacteriales bacterium]MCB9334755.1 DUF4293 domain-containing protein [Flavobacteriales bacterium]
MIQRVQTLFLIGVILLGVLFSFVPVLGFTAYEATYVMSAYKVVLSKDVTSVVSGNMGVGVLEGVIMIVTLIVIFLYKNRQLQMKLLKLNILLITLQVVALMMYVDVAKAAIGPNENDVLVGFEIGCFIPVLSLLLTYLAIRFIKKDDKLVRAADRLR